LDGTARPFSAGKNVSQGASRSLGLLPEHNVWEYVIQLASIIRSVHSANLACRIITPARILIDHKSRLRLSGLGIFDVIDFENGLAQVAQYQQEDLIEFGRLVLALACNSLIAIQKEHINTSVEIIARNYSSDLRTLISHFMTPPSSSSNNTNNNNRVKSINDAMPIIGTRFYTILDNAYIRGDIIENDLSKEIENGRLFRLITKMNIVLERQEMAGDLQWSETGDRYMLKLFRDYVFHQVTPNGHPWVDLSHVIQCLNKFDTGSSDKICLISPDSQNIMIVSYAQLKKCFEKVFNEITSLMNT
jgi:PAB-dependent poly(A)-specific ribonuclease subunit 3